MRDIAEEHLKEGDKLWANDGKLRGAEDKKEKIDAIEEEKKAIKARNTSNYAFTDREINILNKCLNLQDNKLYHSIPIDNHDQDSAILKEKDQQGNTIIEIPAISNINTSPVQTSISAPLEQFIKLKASKVVDYPVKILAPYKLNSWHWNVLEIKIDADEKITCCRYNTDGKSHEVETNVFNQIKALNINKLSFDNTKNTQGDKIELGDNESLQKLINCGLASTLMMHHLKNNNNTSLNNLQEYAKKEDKPLRDEISNIISAKGDQKDKDNFCKPIDENKFINDYIYKLNLEETQFLQDNKGKIEKLLLITDEEKKSFLWKWQEAKDAAEQVEIIKKLLPTKGYDFLLKKEDPKEEIELNTSALICIDYVANIIIAKKTAEQLNQKKTSSSSSTPSSGEMDFTTLIEFIKQGSINEEELKEFGIDDDLAKKIIYNINCFPSKEFKNSPSSGVSNPDIPETHITKIFQEHSELKPKDGEDAKEYAQRINEEAYTTGKRYPKEDLNPPIISGIGAHVIANLDNDGKVISFKIDKIIGDGIAGKAGLTAGDKIIFQKPMEVNEAFEYLRNCKTDNIKEIKDNNGDKLSVLKEKITNKKEDYDFYYKTNDNNNEYKKCTFQDIKKVQHALSSQQSK